MSVQQNAGAEFTAIQTPPNKIFRKCTLVENKGSLVEIAQLKD
jgi:hypothetical protein